MSMIAFTRGIWRVLDILVFMCREMGRSVMDVEFSISRKGILNFLFTDSKLMRAMIFYFCGHQTHSSMNDDVR